jgi:tetratricopeptide (TPR) repeat protein
VRLLRLGQLAEGVEELKAVCQDPALKGDAHLALAHAYREHHNLRMAVKHFEETLATLPTDPAERRHEALYQLARCHAELGQLPQALSLANDLVRLDPGHRDIGQLLHLWQTRAKEAQAS